MQINFGDNPRKLLRDADWALLLGAVPRSKGSILEQPISCVNLEDLACSIAHCCQRQLEFNLAQRPAPVQAQTERSC